MARTKGAVTLPSYHRELVKLIKSLEKRVAKAEKQLVKLSVKPVKKAKKA